MEHVAGVFYQLVVEVPDAFKKLLAVSLFHVRVIHPGVSAINKQALGLDVLPAGASFFASIQHRVNTFMSRIGF